MRTRMDVQEWGRAKGKAAWAAKVLQLFLTGNRGHTPEELSSPRNRQRHHIRLPQGDASLGW